LNDGEPRPVPVRTIFFEVSLNDHNVFSLLSLDNIDFPLLETKSSSLKFSNQLLNNIISLLLQKCQSSGFEEHHGMTKLVLVCIKSFSAFQNDGCNFFQVTGFWINLATSQDQVTLLDIRIDHPVGETSHTNPDAF